MLRLNNKRFIIVTVLLTILTLAISGCSKKEEGIVAKVNGERITDEEFDTDFQVFKKLYERQFGEEALSQVGEDGKTLGETLKENIVEKLIIEKLVGKEAVNKNIKIADEELKETLDEYINGMGGKEKFDEFLKNNELTEEFFKDNLRKELLIEKHKETFLNETTISDKESKDYFEKNKDHLVVVKASHILVKTEEEGKKILDRLKAGEDFASIAAKESIDSASAVQGGDLGYFTKESMIKEFGDVAFSLKKGETSDLVKTEVGYHIIYLEDKKDTYEDLKDDVTSIMKEEKYFNKIQELRDKADVKIYLNTKETKDTKKK